MRKTKIICTIGPACASVDTLKKMMLAGMNVARFNMSHGTHESHHMMIENVKKARAELGLPIAIMIDTKGPEIRVKQFENGSVTLADGQRFVLTTRDVIGNQHGVAVTLPTFNKIVREKDKILLNDGLIKLVVQDVKGTEVECKVLVGGVLSNNKSINIPGVDLDMPYLSKQDESDLLFGIEEGADIFSLSFVSSKHDVAAVRKFLEKNGNKHGLVCAKIESHKSIGHIDEIIDESDSVMVARGDLGVEIDFEKIPYLQKQIIKKCLEKGKNVITATEMLESMLHNPRPTRAEISDVANAVLDGSSCIMLSGETSAGENPVQSVEAMAKIAESTENTIDYGRDLDYCHSKDVSSSIGYAACEMARSLGAKAIVVATKSGYAAKCASRFRPKAKIVACTPDKAIYNQMALYWGVEPLIGEPCENIDKLLFSSREKAIASGLIKKSDTIVQTASLVTGTSGSDLLFVPKV